MTGTDRQWVIMQVLVVAAVALALILLHRPAEPILPVWVGIVLCGISLIVMALAFVAHAQVNRTIQVNVCPAPDSAKKLVVRGIYGYVRHPMYLSGSLVLLGATVWHGNPIAIGGGLMAWLFFYLKAIHEERLLMQAYSDYPEYMLRTGRLFPRRRRKSRKSSNLSS
jgi:protein-S-isoprenylcysteine O-methyltransferase Ste14